MPDGAEPGERIRCDEVVELISDYLEGMLDVASLAEFEAHLALCAACAEYLRQMRITLDAVGRVSLDMLSEQARADLIDAFRSVARSP
ncbi:MAG: zf-HC2 domain-containing protein [Chloroflexota bacterium]|nr:zf-HC2 domain-containing protein [Actinomycetota bacterium]MDQ2966353.1 zf-HC2 domain-containing protein [Chloroflexota bacterium]